MLNFFIFSCANLQPLVNFLHKLKINLSPSHQAKIVVIFTQLHYFNFNYCFRENVKMDLFYQAAARYCMIYFGN